MIPKIKNIMSSDIDNLVNYTPVPPDTFEISLSLDIGLENQEGAEIFQVSVYTPKWFLINCRNSEVFIPRHSLIVLKYDYSEIEKNLNDICKMCEGNNWDECSLKLSRYFLWEFEDYMDSKREEREGDSPPMGTGQI